MDYLWPKKIFVYIHLGLYIWCCPCININDIANGLGNNNGLAYAISMGLGACMTRSSSGVLEYCTFSLINTTKLYKFGHDHDSRKFSFFPV